MAEPPNSSSSAASAVPFTGFGTAVYDINTDPNRFRYERYIRYLIENPWSFIKNRPLKLEYPSPIICDATIHGSMLPRDFRAPPVFRVLPNFMIILASTGPHMGYLARTCLTAYNNLLPPTVEKAPNNILNLFGGLLGIRDDPLYAGLFYGTPGDNMPNRLLTFRLRDTDEDYRLYTDRFYRVKHFGFHELDNDFYRTSPRSRGLLQKILEKYADRTTGYARFTLEQLQSIVQEVYSPTNERPMILYVNSCDASLVVDEPPSIEYMNESQRNTHFHLEPPPGLYPPTLPKIVWPPITYTPVVSDPKDEEAFVLPELKGRQLPPVEDLKHYISAPDGTTERSIDSLWATFKTEDGTPMFSGSAASSGMRENEEEPKRYWGGRLKKRKTYRKKRRWLKSINRKRTGSKRASRSSNR